MGAAAASGARYPVCGTRKIPVRGAGGAILALGESEVLRRVSGKTLFGVAAQGLLPHVHSRASAARGEAEIERGRMDEGIGARETGPRGGSAVRLCNLVAQGPFAPKEQFKREVDKELTGKDTEPWEIIYFKLYQSQIPVVEQAIDTVALMLGTDKSRGYCLEMICADFLAGANLENGNPAALLQSISRFFKFLPRAQKQTFLEQESQNAS